MQCGKEGKQKNRNKGGKNKTRNRFCGYVPSVILMLVFFFLALVAVLFGCDQRAKAIAFVVLCGSIDTYLFSEDQDLILVFIRLRRDHHHHHHLVNLSDSPPSLILTLLPPAPLGSIAPSCHDLHHLTSASRSPSSCSAASFPVFSHP